MNQELNEKKEDEHDEEVNKKKEEEEEEGSAGGRWTNLIKLSCGSPLGGRAVFHFRKIFNSARQRSRFLIFTYKNIN